MDKKILLVDDEPNVRAGLADILRELGYDIIEAGNGQDAIEKARAIRPDLVLMDTCMPDMDGIAAIQAIVKIDPKATVIVCSSMGWSSSMTAAIKAGAKEFFIKPVPPDRFLATVKALLDKKISQA